MPRYKAWQKGFQFQDILVISWFVTWRLCVTREELELSTDIRDFTTLFYVILRHESSGWLAFRDFAFFKRSFCCKNRLL